MWPFKQKLGPKQLKFVKALESGEYEQCRLNLMKTIDEGRYQYCALGVACDLFLGEPRKHGNFYYWGGGTVAYAPNELFDELELKRDDYEYGCVFATSELSVLNDNGYSFKEIAAMIRKDPKRWFKRSV